MKKYLIIFIFSFISINVNSQFESYSDPILTYTEIRNSINKDFNDFRRLILEKGFLTDPNAYFRLATSGTNQSLLDEDIWSLHLTRDKMNIIYVIIGSELFLAPKDKNYNKPYLEKGVELNQRVYKTLELTFRGYVAEREYNYLDNEIKSHCKFVRVYQDEDENYIREYQSQESMIYSLWKVNSSYGQFQRIRVTKLVGEYDLKEWLESIKAKNQ